MKRAWPPIVQLGERDESVNTDVQQVSSLSERLP